LGKGLDVDAFGNVIVLGETNGSLYCSDQGSTYMMIVLTMNKNDGSYYLSPNINGEGVGNDTSKEASSTSQSQYILPDSAIASQTGPDVGPSYAGGMTYVAFTNALYVTGSTYGSFSDPGVGASTSSNCFFGVVSLPKLQWKDRSVFGTESAPEACSAITLAHYLERTEVMIVGSIEVGGLLTGLSTSGRSVQQYGMILDLSNQGGNYVLLGGKAADESEVQFPIQVLASGHQIFMVSMSSRDVAVRPDVDDKRNRENTVQSTISSSNAIPSIVECREVPQKCWRVQ
jgi:hypothetical protein